MYRKKRLNTDFLMLFFLLLAAAVILSVTVIVYNWMKKESAKELLPGIVCFGDSLTAGYIPDSDPAPYSDTLRKLIRDNYVDTDIVNFGASGEDSATITARSGAVPFYVSENTVIPEDSSPVEIVLEDKTGRRLTPLMYMDSGFNSCTLNGIEGTLENKYPGTKNGVYFFRRLSPGESVTVPKGSKLIPSSANLYLDHIPVIFIGANGGFSSYEELTEQIDDVIRYRSAGAGGKYVVIGMYNGSADYLDRYDMMMYSHYREHYISLRSYLAFYGMDEAGLLYDSKDLEAVQSCSVPPSLMSDSVHLTKEGYGLLGKLVFNKMDELGYFDEFGKRKNLLRSLMDEEGKAKKETAKFVKNLPNGINIGNSLDTFYSEEDSVQDLETETLWGNPAISEDYIDALYEDGVRLIRIPVTWDIHMDSTGMIRTAWLSRVKQVVNYAYSRDMYIILDMHHDRIMYPGYEDLDRNIYRLFRIWKQIATEFRDYDQKLIFEGMNEPRLYDTDTDTEWGDGDSDTAFCLSLLNNAFIKAVRGTGGKNLKRYLIVGGYHTGSSKKILSDIRIPSDTHLIIGVHAYLPHSFTQTHDKNTWNMDDPEDVEEIDTLEQDLREFMDQTGLRVIVTEFACLNKTDNEKDRTEWCKYYLDKINGNSIPCLWWDDGDRSEYGLFDRVTGEALYPEICSFFCSEKDLENYQ